MFRLVLREVFQIIFIFNHDVKNSYNLQTGIKCPVNESSIWSKGGPVSEYNKM